MGFNDQAKGFGARGARKFIFKDGVPFKHMTGQQPIMFRLQPAFNPADPNPATSWLPCLDPAGNLNEWGTVIKIVRFVGHGTGGATRQDLLSLSTFDSDGRGVWCPLQALWQAINSDPQTWGYLIEDKGDFKDKNRQRAAFSKVSSHLIANILDVNQITIGNQLGVFTAGASGKLIDRRDGLVFQPNGMPGIDEAVRQNYMMAYANGDITSPHDAPVLVVEKGNEKGDFSAYKISIATDSGRRVIRRPIDCALMAQRFNLTQLDSFINVPTEEDLVQALVQLLNGRSPQGYHEHALLRLTFPNFQIPEPPMAPAATASVAMGGYQMPQGTVPGAAPQGFPGQIPGQIPAGGYQSPSPAPSQPQYVPQQVPQQIPTQIPGQIPAGGYQAPKAPHQGVPYQAPQGGGFAAPAQPQQEPQPMQGGVPVQGQHPNEPVAPGDPVGGFDQNDFVARMRQQKAGQQG